MLRAIGRTASLVRLGRTSYVAQFTPQIQHPNLIASLSTFDQTRWSSNSPPQRKGFLGNLIDNVKEELEKNKELQEHQKQLRKRMEELNDSEALKDARKKFEVVEKETLKSSQVVKAKIEELSDQLSKVRPHSSLVVVYVI
ncbi:unnamed protein product [Nippostrongylus brasiliensis]|uniref:Mitochondrial ATPase inhibitor n=1 Tax=Nippostrongylus brasiliensis TaxID=27835 RepID=A0A0N4YJX5_NIPBR|nr:unnamed protein product [Nippostrongylus brasiliensis]